MPWHAIYHIIPFISSATDRQMTGRIEGDLRSASFNLAFSNTSPKSHSTTPATSRLSAAPSKMRPELPLKAAHQNCLMAVRRPPTIATAEQTLPRKTSTILAQLRTGHSRILGQYMRRIYPTARNNCHDCRHSPRRTHHIFDCPSNPTTLTMESLWTAPTDTAKHLNLAIDESS